ncbi:MAG TPA: hypothetical protein VK508_09445 [Cyclobacteriaceae bacterium]|nr:hypothetical protein [Cyclobacteriaceae bacterium]
MDERLSLKAVEDYSEDFASKVTASFFSKKDKITGPEILKLSSVHQVNLFVIRELLRAWQYEGQKLRSPYFDYAAAEVKEEMERFQNVLSNHIQISKDNFQPLLKKAVSQTLFLVIDPYDFFSDILDRQGSSHVRLTDLKNDIRYLKINKPPLERLVQRMGETNVDIIAGKEAFGLLDQILEEVSFTPEDVDGYIAEFSKIVPLKIDSLYEKKAEPIVVKKAEPPPPTPAPKPVPVPAPATVSSSAPKATLADNFNRISSIKDSLTINQKFMFTKMLFKGDFEIFSEAVEKLDRLDNLNQAMKYFEENYPEWDRETEEYEEFLEMVEKRFA